MILKADQIVQRLLSRADEHLDDPLVIAPIFDHDAIAASGSASIDLRLGSWFSTMRQHRIGLLNVGEKPPAELGKSLTRFNQAGITKMHYVPFGREFILHPRSFVLAVTLEWIRLPRSLAALRCFLWIASLGGSERS
jgi:dCTP deaminase